MKYELSFIDHCVSNHSAFDLYKGSSTGFYITPCHAHAWLLKRYGLYTLMSIPCSRSAYCIESVFTTEHEIICYANPVASPLLTIYHKICLVVCLNMELNRYCHLLNVLIWDGILTLTNNQPCVDEKLQWEIFKRISINYVALWVYLWQNLFG